MSTLIIPVRIRRIDAQYLYLEAEQRVENCEPCARGQGCGARPWFRGLFAGNRPLMLANRREHPWQENDPAELHLPAHLLARLAALAYGVPLAAFLLALLATQQHAEGIQLLAALLLAAVSLWPSRHYSERLLKRHLRLQPRTAVQPCRMSVL